MLKFNTIILTLALSVFTLFLNKAEGDLVVKKVIPTHDVKIDHSFNALAIANHNSFPELLSFSKDIEPVHQNHFYTKTTLTKVAIEGELQYLKTCNAINLNLTKQRIIYPFHSFL